MAKYNPNWWNKKEKENEPKELKICPVSEMQCVHCKQYVSGTVNFIFYECRRSFEDSMMLGDE